ncbi:YfcL family protein [Parashewanella spongiae]|uniref:YfcL family protein n=1 Tax=Parashewanella spongiae TaxID=342950 RepID=A0A3A6U4P9_9GAMM|nr:YfcL family protein [Parashewanella spongiae]MCL1076907.1 YfcL family protein [Parashewanella spongiae]RJY19156.1 YfcL family protein [Parashewanella spongiae]
MLEQYEAALENWIGEVVAHGDDDALFASGYLQGHIAVVLSELDIEGDCSYVALEDKVKSCMLLAKDELNEGDFKLVDTAWLELKNRLK